MSTTLLHAGFLPLLDSVLLVLAKELGFAETEGFALNLTRETSWANIRDRSALGHFDVAQMLAPMPIATSLGLTPIATRMIAPVALGLGNNAITVSAALWEEMAAEGAINDLEAKAAGVALAKMVAKRGKKLRFAVVHQTSSHNYELRYWLAASGITPDRDIEIVVLPPPLLPEALGARQLDGYCVGEPWNSIGVDQFGARIVTTKSRIWQWSPDKVIGMRADWAERNEEVVAGLVRAIVRAGEWCQKAENRMAAAEIMARAEYLDQPVEIVARSLTGRIETGGQVFELPDFFVPQDGAANFPWKSHALWYFGQMVCWGEAKMSAENVDIAAACFAPEIFRSAVEPLGVKAPAVDFKREGDSGERHEVGGVMLGPNRFFDGGVFDPAGLKG